MDNQFCDFSGDDSLLTIYDNGGSSYNGYCGQLYSLVMKTDNTSQTGHDWVTITSCHRHWTMAPLLESKLYKLFPNCEIVKPCNDKKALPGSLMCEDEFNYCNDDDRERALKLWPKLKKKYYES